jgi:hypothetical protein
MANPTSSDATKVPAATRRRELLRAGIGLAAAASSVAHGLAAPAVARDPITVPKAPNIIVLMTDQERHHVHWPDGWAEMHLPSLQRLKRNGLNFQRAYTAACQCSPSRGLMLTGRFSPVNRVTRTFLWPGLPHQDRQPNIGSLLKEKAGYDIIW